MSLTHKSSTWVQTIFTDELKQDSLLGSGSYGIVSLGSHRQFGKVAYKQFKQHGINKKLDQREIDTLRMFNGHPNIVRIYGMLSERKASEFHFGFVMEWMNYSLATVMLQHDYNTMNAVNWFRGISAGLAVLHENNVIHRDIRPDNVLTDNTFEQTRLCDFGLSTELRIEMTAGRGCFGYMAPELLNVTELCQYTSSCDMYSFGVLMEAVLSKRQVNTSYCEEPVISRLNNMITSCCGKDAYSRLSSQDALDALVDIQEELSTFENTAQMKKEAENGNKQAHSKQETLLQQQRTEKEVQTEQFGELSANNNYQERVALQLENETRKRQEAVRQRGLAYEQKQSLELLLAEEVCERKIAEEQVRVALGELQHAEQQLQEENRKHEEAVRERDNLIEQMEAILDKFHRIHQFSAREHQRCKELKKQREAMEAKTQYLGDHAYSLYLQNQEESSDMSL